MPSPEIGEFARILVEQVRDPAIQSCDMTLNRDGKYATAIRWREARARCTPKEFAAMLIPDIVDSVLFHLLHAIDGGSLEVTFSASSGKSVNLTQEGMSELAGWYASKDWPKAYSKERWFDDLADLDADFGQDGEKPTE